MKILLIAAHNVSTALLSAIKNTLEDKDSVEVVERGIAINEVKPRITLPIKPYVMEAMHQCTFFAPKERKPYTKGQTYKHKKRK